MPKCLDGKQFEAVSRDGTTYTEEDFLGWRHHGSGGDLMKYRIIEKAPDYSKGFPEGTTAKDIGAKVGDEFVVVKPNGYFKKGEIIHLDLDDGSTCPRFHSSNTGNWYIEFKSLSPTQQKPTMDQQPEVDPLQPDADGWIEWKGGECPVEKGTLVDVKFRGCGEEIGIPALEPSDRNMSAYNWDNDNVRGDITAYRIHQSQEWPEDRVDIVGQNGNDGLHYVAETSASTERVEQVQIIDVTTSESKDQQIVYVSGCEIYTSPEHVEKQEENVHMPTTAPEFLQSALNTLTQRGKDYDKPEGERSASAVAVAFNAITGKQLTEAEVWLVLQLVKDVRQWQNPERYHADSALDCVAYAALKAEALAGGGK